MIEEDIDKLSVPQLQERLLKLENSDLEALRKDRRLKVISHQEYDTKWEAICQGCAIYRKRLFALTGDPYGRSAKPKPVRPADDLLEAEYASPDEVPAEVMDWIRRHTSIITGDATDAGRWSRIVDTLKDERYPSGELTIYRAVDGDTIRPGDWVTTERSYAEDHLRRYLNGHGQIIEDIVDGRDILVSPTGNSEEAIYAPRGLSGPVNRQTPKAKKPSANSGLGM